MLNFTVINKKSVRQCRSILIPLNFYVIIQVNLETVQKICYEEIKDLKNNPSITSTDIESLLKFNDCTFCDEIDLLCPTLAAAIKGGIGMKADDVKSKASRATIYGSIFKSR